MSRYCAKSLIIIGLDAAQLGDAARRGYVPCVIRSGKLLVERI